MKSRMNKCGIDCSKVKFIVRLMSTIFVHFCNFKCVDLNFPIRHSGEENSVTEH